MHPQFFGEGPGRIEVPGAGDVEIDLLEHEEIGIDRPEHLDRAVQPEEAVIPDPFVYIVS